MRGSRGSGTKTALEDYASSSLALLSMHTKHNHGPKRQALNRFYGLFLQLLWLYDPRAPEGIDCGNIKTWTKIFRVLWSIARVA